MAAPPVISGMAPASAAMTGTTTCHSFDLCEPKPLVQRGIDEAIGEVVDQRQVIVGHVIEKIHSVFDLQLPEKIHVFSKLVPRLAGYHQSVRNLIFESREGAREDNKIFFGVQAADK